jgi:hypothetical protein
MLLQFMEKVHSSGGSRIVEAAAASFSFEELYGVRPLYPDAPELTALQGMN